MHTSTNLGLIHVEDVLHDEEVEIGVVELKDVSPVHPHQQTLLLTRGVADTHTRTITRIHTHTHGITDTLSPSPSSHTITRKEPA